MNQITEGLKRLAATCLMLVSAVLLVTGCGDGHGGRSGPSDGDRLTRERAKAVIEGSSDFKQFAKSKFTFHGNDVGRGDAAGLWNSRVADTKKVRDARGELTDSMPAMFGYIVEFDLTYKGARIFKTPVRTSGDQAVELTLSEPLNPEIVEVTGISGTGVEFTWRYVGPAKDALVQLKLVEKQSNAVALLRSYDDGWRVAQLTGMTPELPK